MAKHLARLFRLSVMVPREHRLAKNWGETQTSHPNTDAGQARLAHGENRAFFDADFRAGAVPRTRG